MPHAIRIPRRWQIRLAGAVLLLLALCNMRLLPCAVVLLLALLPVLTSLTSTYADDRDVDDRDDNANENTTKWRQQVTTGRKATRCSHHAPDT